jgi:voltage-gated potassium channel Kch
MIVHFLLILGQVRRAVRYAWLDSAFRFLFFLTIGVLAIGTSFYHLVEEWRWLDSLYFCVMTLATVGYGDFSPQTDAGKIFTIFYVLIGIGIVFAIFSRLAEALLASHRVQLQKQPPEQD